MVSKANVTPLKLYLLGPLRLETASGSLRLSARKAESLLAYLVLYPQEHTREKLATLLWGESADTQARDSLRTALKTLRKQLGDEIIVADREAVQLNPAFPLWADARELRETVEGGQTTDLQIAVALYRGELLADFYDEWIFSERERYRTLYLEILLRLTKESNAHGDYPRAVEYAQKILAADATNEAAHQALMRAFVANGNRQQALKQYEECKRVLRAELDIAPSPETTALYQEIKQRATVPNSAAQRTNVPIPLTSFVGRQKEIQEIKNILARQRLVTLTGAGGSGKTRLATQVATELENDFQHGVWWIELVGLNDPTLIEQAVANVLGLREVPNQLIRDTLVNELRSKQLLLVLDNCEHLIEACAQLAARLLQACPAMKILTTSREPFALFGESVYRVPTLSLPTTLELPVHQVLEHEATHLFVERALAMKSDFALTSQNAVAVGQICRRLDGIPLAIELAVARIQVLSPEEIAARLDDRFGLLTGGSRTALPRHQTLRATIDWSHGLLTEPERVLFRRLSVFAGGFPLDAAGIVCAGNGIAQPEVLDLLSHLVDKSLVMVMEQGTTSRYRLLETIREYAREKLGAAGEEDTLRNLHLLFFINLAEQAEPELERALQGVWQKRLEGEIDNLRTAIEWALASADTEAALRLVGSLRRFWFPFGAHRTEGFERLKAILGRADAQKPTRARLRALNTYLFMLWPTHELSTAQLYFDEAFTLASRLGDRQSGAFTLTLSGCQALETGDYLTARTALEQGIAQWREIGDRGNMMQAECFLGEVAMFQADFTRAQAIFESVLLDLRQVLDYPYLGIALRRLGQLAMYQGDLPRAEHLIRESLAANLSVQDYIGAGACLGALADLRLTGGDIEHAMKLLGMVSIVLQYIHIPLLPYDQELYERNLFRVREQYDRTPLAAAWAEGHAMTIEQVIALAQDSAISRT